MDILKIMGKEAKRKRKDSVLYGRLSANIFALRNSQKPKITQKALEEATGCYHGQLSHVETGVRGISLENIERIAEYFGMDPGTLLQPVREQREWIRSLLEGLGQENIESLRGNPEYHLLIDKLRNVMRREGPGGDGLGMPKDSSN